MRRAIERGKRRRGQGCRKERLKRRNRARGVRKSKNVFGFTLLGCCVVVLEGSGNGVGGEVFCISKLLRGRSPPLGWELPKKLWKCMGPVKRREILRLGDSREDDKSERQGDETQNPQGRPSEMGPC